MCHVQETTLILFVMYLSPLTSEVYLLVNLFTKLYITFILIGLLSYLVEMRMRTSRHVVCKRENSHFLRYVLISLDIRDLPCG